jgi:hypothetical protein
MNTNKTQTEQLTQVAVMQSVILPNELRIGNFIEYFGIREVIAIKKHKIKVQHESKQGNFIIEWCPITSLSLEPIPLTDDWLKKLGFKQDIGEPERFFNDFISLGKYGIHRVIEYNGFDFTITYVHQLQNLHFALTQRDLTVA